jgi:orotidine-5'-phosphate decarboxylase
VTVPACATVVPVALLSTETSAGFADRFVVARKAFGPLVLGVDPSGDILRAWGVGDDPDGLDRFIDVVVEVAIGAVGVVKLQSAFYERFGWRGIRSLARLAAACRAGQVLVLLDAKRGDVGSTNDAYAEAYLGPTAGIEVDALTVTPYLGFAALRPFFDRAYEHGAGVFVVTRSSNPEGRALQTARGAHGLSVEQQLVSDLAVENSRVATGGLGPFGSVFCANHGPPVDMDLVGMGGLFLCPGVGAQGASPADVAACFASCPDRVLPSASRSLLAEGPDPSRLRGALSTLGGELQEALGL